MKQAPSGTTLTALAAAALFLGQPVLAMDAAKRQESQQAMKERVLDHIDAKIRVLQEARSCVRAAADMEAMTLCHAQERKQMKDLRDKDRQGIQDGPR
jgi:RNase H-fold protein (predicted Holliday junction resolvase)